MLLSSDWEHKSGSLDSSGPWVHLQVNIWKTLPRLCVPASRDAAVLPMPSHTTLLGHWVTRMIQRFFGFGHCGFILFLFFFFFFFFFALLLENEIFSSFLRNKLVNKFILFCFSFPQSFIFNPIPFRLHSFPLLLPGVAAIGLLSCCRSQQALSTRGLHLLISSCFFCKLVNKLN